MGTEVWGHTCEYAGSIAVKKCSDIPPHAALYTHAVYKIRSSVFDGLQLAMQG